MLIRKMKSVSMYSRNMPMPRDRRLAKMTFDPRKEAHERELWKPEVLRTASQWQTGSDTCFCSMLKGEGRQEGQLVHRVTGKEACGSTWQC